MTRSALRWQTESPLTGERFCVACYAPGWLLRSEFTKPQFSDPRDAEMPATTTPETLCFTDGKLVLIDQTRLPVELVTLECSSVEQTHDAIRRLVVRGAPAIGIAAAYGVCLAANSENANLRDSCLNAVEYLATSRPTAVNLFWCSTGCERLSSGPRPTTTCRRH